MFILPKGKFPKKYIAVNKTSLLTIYYGQQAFEIYINIIE